MATFLLQHPILLRKANDLRMTMVKITHINGNDIEDIVASHQTNNPFEQIISPDSQGQNSSVLIADNATPEQINTGVKDWGVNSAFSDDLLVTIDNPSTAEVDPTAFVLRFDYKNNFPHLLTRGSEIKLVTDDGQEFTAHVHWVNDEAKNVEYKLDIDYNFGYNYDLNTDQFTNPITSGSDSINTLKELIDTKLHLQELEANDTQTGDNDIWLTSQDLQELQTALEALAINTNNQCGMIYHKIRFDPATQSISLEINVTPPAKKIDLQIDWVPFETNNKLPENTKKRLTEEMSQYFKEPYTNQNLLKGYQKLAKAYSSQKSDYIITTWDPTMPPEVAKEWGVEPSYKADGTLVIPIRLQPNYFRMEIEIHHHTPTGDFIRTETIDPQTIDGLKLKFPLNSRNLDSNSKEIFAHYGREGYLVSPGEVKNQNPGVAHMGLQTFPAPQKEDIQLTTNLLPDGRVAGQTDELSWKQSRQRGPTGEEIQDLFSDSDGRVTTESLAKGQVTLHQWYNNKGYVLKPVNYVDANSDGLLEPVYIDISTPQPIGAQKPSVSIRADVVTVAGFEIEAGDLYGQRWLDGYTDIHFEERNAYLTSVQADGSTLRVCVGTQVDEDNLESLKKNYPSGLEIVFEPRTIKSATPDQINKIASLAESQAVQSVEKETKEGHRDILETMLEIQELGRPLNKIELERVLSIVSSQYLLGGKDNNYTIHYTPVTNADGTLQLNEKGESTYRIIVTREDSAKFDLRLGADGTGANAAAAASYEFESGTSVTPSLGVSGLPNYGQVSGGVSLQQPWINDRGTMLDAHTSASWLPYADGYNSQTIGANLATPIGSPSSPWSVLYGIDLQRLAQEVNNPTFWAQPNAGIRYMQNGFLVEVTAGPRMSFNGSVYSELSVKVSKKTFLSKNHRVYINTAGGATVRVGSDPGDIVSWALQPVGPFKAQAWACVGLMFSLDPYGKWNIGPATWATTSGMLTQLPEAGVGAMMEGAGMTVGFGPGIGPTGVVPSLFIPSQ